MPLRSPLVVLTLALGLATASAAAAGETAARSPTAPARIEEIPAIPVEVTREIVVPAVVRRVCTPVYAEVELPIRELRRTPRYQEIEAPVHAWRLVPVYRTRREPLYGTRLEPLYEDVTRRVSLPLRVPGSCACTAIPLYETCAKRQIAWLETEEIVGYRTDSLPRGMRREAYVARTETRRVLVGYDEQVVQVGTRTQRRLKGYACEEVEVVPARTEIARVTVTLPPRRVTVAPAGGRTTPLPGTTVVLTPAEYAAALAPR